ncbi:uncharacterized protein LOC131007887 [Salvia miltiorrhiza]|uniref:uncharacterized protein LOC131007887 n=1 Tax=Salvia miltiorrhiza TaxID=226208 RepID=UPI0025AD1711|nr:uncharacterized protein LOC131007887 [Salvia miltiorrhiza]
MGYPAAAAPFSFPSPRRPSARRRRALGAATPTTSRVRWSSRRSRLEAASEGVFSGGRSGALAASAQVAARDHHRCDASCVVSPPPDSKTELAGLLKRCSGRRLEATTHRDATSGRWSGAAHRRAPSHRRRLVHQGGRLGSGEWPSKVLRGADKFKTWLSDKEAVQQKTTAFSKPAFTSDQVYDKILDLQDKVASVNRTPKPKPKVEKPAKVETENGDDKANSTDSASEETTSAKDQTTTESDDVEAETESNGHDEL